MIQIHRSYGFVMKYAICKSHLFLMFRQEREGHCDEQVSLQQVRGCGSHLRQDPAGGTW